MISVDTNILVYAADKFSPSHRKALAFMQSQMLNQEFVLSEPVLVELYMALRNKAVMPEPLPAKDAVDYCNALRTNPNWRVVDMAPAINDTLWKMAAQKNFAFRRIIDARIGLSLSFHGVEEFATANVKDFEGCGFKKVWNPL